MVVERKRGRRNRSEWKNMTARELTYLMANRVARIKILEMEIAELEKMIKEKSK
jgi:hypothetical protein